MKGVVQKTVALQEELTVLMLRQTIKILGLVKFIQCMVLDMDNRMVPGIL